MLTETKVVDMAAWHTADALIRRSDASSQPRISRPRTSSAEKEDLVATSGRRNTSESSFKTFYALSESGAARWVRHILRNDLNGRHSSDCRVDKTAQQWVKTYRSTRNYHERFDLRFPYFGDVARFPT